MRYRSLAILITAIASNASAIEFTALRDNAWAATQPTENRFNDCNSLIVEGDDFVVVVDAQESLADVDQIIAFVKATTDKPVRFLVNTHWHSDHTRGNTRYHEVFGDELAIIGHITQREDIFERAEVDLKERVAQTKEVLPAARQQLVTGIKRDGTAFTPEELEAQSARVEAAAEWVMANKDVAFTGPTVLVTEPYSIDARDASFTVYPLRGHTRGDLAIHFPKLALIATGDLVDEMPYSGHGYPREWITALADIKALGANTYLPGHGAVLTGNTLIDNLSRYFESLVAKVAALAAEGKSADEIKAEIDLSASRTLLAGDDEAAGRFFDQVQGEAIDRVLLELVDAPKKPAER